MNFKKKCKQVRVAVVELSATAEVSCRVFSDTTPHTHKLNQRRATASFKLPRTLIHCAMQLATLTTGVSSRGLLSDFGFSWTPLQDSCFDQHQS